jgi:anti-sigma B factor antagonist
VSVKLNTRQVGGVSVVDVAGRITLGEGSSALRDTLRDMVAKNNKKILLNLGDVSYIDSSGIGELVSGFTSVTNSGGQLKLLGLSKRVKDLLQITKLYTVFDVHEEEGSAIRSFS